MTSKTVFVVGTPEGAKVNQYEHMTNCAKEAAKLAAEMGTQGVIKEVKVPPSRHRGGR
jgi:hypothetical protein